MTREEFYNELQVGLIQRFQTLSEEEKDIVRKNVDSEYGHIMEKILGNEILSGIPRIKYLNE
jgi:hypothetical protein